MNDETPEEAQPTESEPAEDSSPFELTTDGRGRQD
jgi:hypothetical protein